MSDGPEDPDAREDSAAPDRDALDALTTALALKDETRTGWALRGVRAEAGKQAVSDAEKTARERDAVADFADALPRGDELRDLWAAYESRDTPEAAFVKDMDLVDEFFATAEPRLRTDTGRELFAAVRERYGNVKRGRGNRQ